MELKNALRDAKSYAHWALAAKALDDQGEGKRWKALERSEQFDYATIRRQLHQLRKLRRRGDSQSLVYVLEEGVHGNVGGIGKPILYSKACFGTKQLITDYIDTVAETLLHIESLPDSEVSPSIKLDLFKRASHCYGRSALMFSGGGSLMYFHIGVAKSLLQQGLLPSVLSGASAGSLVCAMLGTRSDKELADFLTPENVCFGRAWEPGYLERLTGLRRLLDVKDFDESFPRMVPDITFREAFEISGRHISISVSANERHHSPRLLNAITSPHVLIRSAVRASCAIPGLFEPVQLLARNSRGNTVPYLNLRWIDGGFAADLPAKQLARLYGTNHYIVSLINPISLLTFRDHKLESPRLLPLLHMVKNITQYYAKSVDTFLGKYLDASTLGTANRLLQGLLSQKYRGDISIVPETRLNSPLKLMSPFTLEEIAALIKDGEHQTWPRVEMIRNSSKISRTLDGILKRAGEDGHSGY